MLAARRLPERRLSPEAIRGRHRENPCATARSADATARSGADPSFLGGHAGFLGSVRPCRGCDSCSSRGWCITLMGRSRSPGGLAVAIASSTTSVSLPRPSRRRGVAQHRSARSRAFRKGRGDRAMGSARRADGPLVAADRRQQRLNAAPSCAPTSRGAVELGAWAADRGWAAAPGMVIQQAIPPAR